MTLWLIDRRPIASLAATALLLAALLPALSSWWIAVRTAQSPWLVICSVHNPLAAISSRATDTNPADTPLDAEARCPLCLSHACADLPPLQRMNALFTLAASTIVPVLFLHAPRPLFSWAAVRSRGPPVHF